MASNRYALTFTFNDGSAHSVEFEVPPGEPGYTPKKGVDYFDGAKGDPGPKGDAFTYADFTAEQLAGLKGEKGEKGDKGEQGIQGEKGDPGYTPVRGVDYWTEDDKAIIMSEIAKSEDAPAIICEKSGSVVSANDASDRLLKGLTLYGKTTQAGTPTPENPVELVSAGASGAINTTVCGKNLFGGDALADRFVETSHGTKDAEAKTVKYTASHALESLVLFDQFKPNTQYTIIWTTTAESTGGSANMYVVYTDGTGEVLRYKESAGVKRKIVYVTRAGKSVARITGVYYGGTQYLLYEESGIFEGVLTEADFEPYNAQTLTASTPNGLPGIPVASGGNYTDENGQQWICDEIDFDRGVYVQRVGKADLGQQTWLHATSASGFTCYCYPPNMADVGTGNRRKGFICSHYPASVNDNVSTLDNKSAVRRNNGFYARNDDYTGVGAFNASLSGVMLLYALATPTETALSAEELAQYATLHTNKPSTTVYNDAGAGLAVKYVADTKKYIDNKFTELQNAILSAGANI